MSRETIIIGIVLFTFVTIIIYMWGLKKSIKQDKTLREMLMTKGANKVLSYLKKNEAISRKQISEIISDIKVSEFHSKKTVVVQNQTEFTAALISFMLDKGLIIKDKDKYRKAK